MKQEICNKEFIANGGEVGYFWLENEQNSRKKFEKSVEKSKLQKDSDKAKNKTSDFIDFIGNINSTVELVTKSFSI